MRGRRRHGESRVPKCGAGRRLGVMATLGIVVCAPGPAPKYQAVPPASAATTRMRANSHAPRPRRLRDRAASLATAPGAATRPAASPRPAPGSRRIAGERPAGNGSRRNRDGGRCGAPRRASAAAWCAARWWAFPGSGFPACANREHLVEQRAGIAWPLIRIVRGRPGERVRRPPGNARVLHAGGRNRVVRVLVGDLHGLLARERLLARDHLVRHDSHGVVIASRVGDSAGHEFGREIRDRAEQGGPGRGIGAGRAARPKSPILMRPSSASSRSPV